MPNESALTWKEMFPDRRGVALQGGHADSMTGPRCLVQMSEGPLCGLYIIAHTPEGLLTKGDEVLVNERLGSPHAHPLKGPPHG